MSLTKIQVYGFKSFADKLEIKFGKGVTGIVGPNGCGKSNVAEVIMWVIGDTKLVRGRSADDMIFKGTYEKDGVTPLRKKLSYCEASLFFDNSDKSMATEYNDVVITRKLFRSGESEYYINSNQCRLRDITDLLHSCGVGKDGYSVIGQGKVEAIMSAKPEVRRSVFEEATGIALHKKEKIESERKLDRVEENLKIFLAEINQIESNLKPLESQAEDTKKYLKLAEELKRHEINNFLYKFDGADGEKKKLKERIDGINDNLSVKRSEEDKIKKEYDKILSDINLADDTLKILNEQRLEKTVKLERTLGDSKLYGEKISFFNSQIERINDEVNFLNEEYENFEIELNEHKATAEENKNKLKELNKKAAEIESRIEEIDRRLSIGEESEEKSRGEVMKTLESLSDIQMNIGSISAQRQAIEEKKNEICEKLKTLQEKLDSVNGEITSTGEQLTDAYKRVDKLKIAIDEKNAELDKTIGEADAINAKISAVNNTITSRQVELSFAYQVKNSYEGYKGSVKNLLLSAQKNSELAKKIKGVLANLIHTDKEYELAIENAIGSNLQNVVTANTDDTKYLIDFLKRNEAGKVTFLPVSSFKPILESEVIMHAQKEKGAIGLAVNLVQYDSYIDNIVRGVLGNTLICDNVDNAVNIANKYSFGFKIATLDGDIFNPRGSITGGSNNKSATQNLMANDRKIQELTEELERLKKQSETLNTQLSEAEEQKKKGYKQAEKLKNDHIEAKENVLLFTAKTETLSSTQEEVFKEKSDYENLLGIAQQKLAKIDESRSEIESGDKELREMKKSAEDKAQEHKNQSDLLAEERENLYEELTSLKVEIASVVSENSQIESDFERIEDDKKQNKKEIEKREINKKNALEMIEELKKNAEKSLLNQSDKKEIDEIREKIEDIGGKKKGLQSDLSQADLRKGVLATEIKKLEERLYADNFALEKIDTDIQVLREKIYEEYQETDETCVKYREENYPINRSNQEINRLKKEINALGPINHQAIEAYADLKAEFDEKNLQKEDLLKSKDDLRKVIASLQTEMLKVFNEGFETISKNFTRIFKELFGGGNAELRLDYENCEDPLNAGVEINAEPPGKKLQNIVLLSGGERAYTAIAILFAILKMRPMPFCVLDEIEAALDEANVVRFAKYLKKYSDDTQFIVITHKKQTMEEADALYGVTMEEKGVSKLVSVKISDVVETLGEERL